MAIPRATLLLALLAIGGQASAATSGLSEAEAVGKAIFEQDRAARLATDRLLESNGLRSDGLRGWVTVRSDNGWRVLFVEGEGDAYCSKLSVLVDEDRAGSLRRSESCEPLTPDQRAMFLARETAVSALRTRCSDVYNTVVLPHEGKDAAWAVYLLAATREAGKVVVGGHVRVLVRDGSSDVVKYEPLSNACLTLALPSPGTGAPAGLLVSHVLDDHPIETHVFLSLLHELPLYVVTESAMWSVDKGKIGLLMDGDDFKAYLARANVAQDKAQGRGNK